MREETEGLSVLLFEIEGQGFCVDADVVTSVIAWREPAPFPGGHPRIRGILLDGNEVITILHHPFARSPLETPPRRIVLCDTGEGRIGLAVHRTFEIENVSGSPKHGQALETPRGSSTYAAAAELLKGPLPAGEATSSKPERSPGR
ncbi:MAG: chemotaxis protein CheW [Myxococcota bacterium]